MEDVVYGLQALPQPGGQVVADGAAGFGLVALGAAEEASTRYGISENTIPMQRAI